LNDERIQNPSNPSGIVPLSNFVPRGFAFVHHSIAILYHEVPNLSIAIRNFFIAVPHPRAPPKPLPHVHMPRGPPSSETPPTAQCRRNDATEFDHAEMTALSKGDTNCAAPSLIPTVNGNTVLSFSTHGQQSAANGSLTTVARSDIRLIQRSDSSALGWVRRWLIIGYVFIHLFPHLLPHPRTTFRSPRKPNHCLSLTSV
jgi:hypothetical protein